jgi:DNA-binding MarR family transcriptional regulator
MEFLLPPPTREVDVDFLVFVERYATDLLKWDILTFFARNPNFGASASQIAQQLGRSIYSIQPELGDLALLGILEQRPGQGDETTYHLTPRPHLRRIILKFAHQLADQPII